MPRNGWQPTQPDRQPHTLQIYGLAGCAPAGFARPDLIAGFAAITNATTAGDPPGLAPPVDHDFVATCRWYESRALLCRIAPLGIGYRQRKPIHPVERFAPCRADRAEQQRRRGAQSHCLGRPRNAHHLPDRMRMRWWRRYRNNSWWIVELLTSKLMPNDRIEAR